MPARPSGGNNVPGRGRRPGCSLRWTRQPSPVLGGDALLPAARPSKAPPSMTDPIIIAVPKGRILDEALPLLAAVGRSEEHTSELQSLMRISYAVFCLKNNTQTYDNSSYAS